VLVYAFIHAPFDRLVRSNSRFWNVSGIDVDVSAEGISVRTESMESVLFGGLAFETPNTPEPKQADLEGVIFTVHDNRDSVAETAFTQRVRFVMYFGGSVRGLSIGAPVEFKGIKIGEVVDVRLEFNPGDTSFRIPVLVEIEPQRVVARGEAGKSARFEMLKILVERGLRAQLQTGSLLTGQLFIELDMHPGTPIKLANAGGPYPELPTVPASLAEIERSLKNFLARLEKLDLETISVELIGTLQGARALVSSNEVRATMTDLRASVGTLRSVLGKVDRRVAPLTDNVSEAMVAGRDALTKLQLTLELVNEVLKSDSPLQYRAVEMAEELTETARSIRAFVDLLERNPDAMLFGKPPPGTK